MSDIQSKSTETYLLLGVIQKSGIITGLSCGSHDTCVCLGKAITYEARGLGLRLVCVPLRDGISTQGTVILNNDTEVTEIYKDLLEE